MVFAQELTDLSALESAIAEVKPDNGSDVSAEIAAESATEPAATAAECDVSQNPYNLPCELMPLWEKLSIKQKAAQMVMVYMTPADFMIKNEFGGYLVMKNHLKKLDNFQENLKTVNSTMIIPPIVAVDQEGGLVNRVSAINPKWERTPSAKSMRKMTNEKVENIGRKIGAAMKEVGINVNLAPVLDPSKDSRGKNSFMEESDRSWGADTTNANKVRSFVDGMRQSGIVCVSKHFPGYDSWTNSDHQIAISATPKAKIQKNVEFFKALSNDIPITMMSSVRFVRISNRPAVFEPKIVQMARDMSPETVILTDDLWGVSLRAWVSGTERVKGKNYPAKDFKKLVLTALTAGNDMFMITFPRKAVDMVNILANLSKQSGKYKQRVEESAARILKMKYKSGILQVKNGDAIESDGEAGKANETAAAEN
ncbi:MAG: hypothetical protein MJZ25_12340 [Fibrobacter sp.]|nr:hypothetical protein [Fibrobacter sp.]